MKKLILFFLMFFFILLKVSYSQELKGKTLIAGLKSDRFTFISQKKLIWTNSLNDEKVIKKKKLKYDYKDGLLRITLFWKKNGFIEAETYYLFYDKKNNIFVDKEVNLIWYFVK